MQLKIGLKLKDREKIKTFLKKYVKPVFVLICFFLRIRRSIRIRLFGPFRKSVDFQDVSIDIFIRTRTDFGRSRSYESYPVRFMKEYCEKNPAHNNIIYYEVGACLGISALLIAKMLKNRGKVVAFEAEPTNYKSFVENIRLNELDNIIALPIGISDHSGITDFYYNV